MSSIAQILMDKWSNNPTGLKADYRSKLEDGVWIVEFKKVDGTPTTMECTLDPHILPPQKETLTERHVNDELLSVYSPDRQGWRSFKIANVTAFYEKPENM